MSTPGPAARWCVQIFAASDSASAARTVVRLRSVLGERATVLRSGGPDDPVVVVETLDDRTAVRLVRRLCAEVDPTGRLVHTSSSDQLARVPDGQPLTAA
ncbi:MAG: hypothetical protein PGN07_00250 [Aeromicrobium erythreum]